MAVSLVDIYDEGAPIYDAIWASALRPVTERVVARLPLADRRCVLDLASGVGTLLPVLARAAPGARVVAVDRSAGMMRLRPPPFPAVQTDLQRLGLRDGVGDAALLAFALFHLPDPERGLLEVARVLAPDGVAAVVVWAARDADPLMDALWVAALDAHGAPAIDPPERHDELMDTPEKITQLLTRAGFASVDAWHDAIEWRPSIEDFVTYRSQMGVFGLRFAGMSAAAQRAFLDDVMSQLSALTADERVDRTPVVCAIAHR
ncbi:MAG: class I SAM-dependent methyltransferase [Mycobacteriales bacterium]